MTQDETLQHLRAAKAALAQRFGVVDLALFGYAARAEVGPTTDADIPVVCDGPATPSRNFGVQFYLEDLLGRPVDLVTGREALIYSAISSGAGCPGMNQERKPLIHGARRGRDPCRSELKIPWTEFFSISTGPCAASCGRSSSGKAIHV